MAQELLSTRMQTDPDHNLESFLDVVNVGSAVKCGCKNIKRQVEEKAGNHGRTN